MKPAITDLPDLVEALDPGERAVFERIFEVSATTGRLVPPAGMRPWIEKSFGSVDAVREQRIVRVTNRVTLEGTLFNGLRAVRPMDTGTDLELEQEIASTAGDPFCNPEEGTPADTFGRVRGEHSVTASNVAKYDGYHGLVIFDDHNPLHLTPEKVDDYLTVGLEWHRRVLEEDPEARYFFPMWNCLWRAGGSIIHGHVQLAAARGAHYPKVERLRRDAAAYAARCGGDYFDDLYRVHAALGLDLPCPEGVRGFAGLAPVKEKEIWLLGRSLEDRSLRRAVGAVLRSCVDELGVRSFNAAFLLPPIPGGREWSGFPAVVRIVDRGDPAGRTSDIGAMELYAASVVASDPFRVAEALRRQVPKGTG